MHGRRTVRVRGLETIRLPGEKPGKYWGILTNPGLKIGKKKK